MQDKYTRREGDRLFSDNKDFYPTPQALFRRLTENVRHFSGRILEPSAGAGDMIRHIKARASRDVVIDAIENDSRLVSQLYTDGHNVVWDDFLTYKTFKEYDFIVMNPPFSNGVDHALKALELAEAQLSACEVFIVLNKETLNNAYSTKRQELLRKLDVLGADIEYVSEGFTEADRKTDVEVALIRAVVIPEDKSGDVYERVVGSMGAKDVESDETEALSSALSTYVKSHEIQAKMDDIERMVQEYKLACKYVKDAYSAFRTKERFISYVNEANKTFEEEIERKRAEAEGREVERGYRSGKFTSVVQMRYTAEDLNNELERIRRGYWELILRTDDFREHLTQESTQKLNRQIEAATDLEINLANVRMLLLAIQSNHTEMLTDSIINMFERITEYHMNQYSTNVHYYNGWKTNDAYKINHKIIVPIGRSYFDSWDFGEDYSRINMDVRWFIEDLTKAFQLIDPTVGGEFTAISDKEFENDLLRFRMFLNGNIHVWFKDDILLAKFNYFCGQHFAWIPGADEVKTDVKAREFVVKEFGGIYEITLLEGEKTPVRASDGLSD